MPERVDHISVTKSRTAIPHHDRWRSERSHRERNAALRFEEAGREGMRNVRLYPLQLPEQRFDGVTFQSSTKLLRIEE